MGRRNRMRNPRSGEESGRGCRGEGEKESTRTAPRINCCSSTTAVLRLSCGDCWLQQISSHIGLTGLAPGASSKNDKTRFSIN